MRRPARECRARLADCATLRARDPLPPWKEARDAGPHRLGRVTPMGHGAPGPSNQARNKP